MVILDVLVGARLSPQSRITIHYKSIIYTPCQDGSLSVVSATVELTILCRYLFDRIKKLLA
nr:MAG TPA: hypothetical protein [Caudoviricetes sp.]DAS91424.1 MAG TPA: hypothetical protein [Caudoviricetes sp.]